MGQHKTGASVGGNMNTPTDPVWLLVLACVEVLKNPQTHQHQQHEQDKYTIYFISFIIIYLLVPCLEKWVCPESVCLACVVLSLSQQRSFEPFVCLDLLSES